MSAAGEVRIERDGAIATVVLDRPAKLNAMTRAMWASLGAAIESLSADDDVRCVILRGAGEKAFSPGNDIGEFVTERSNKAQARDYGAMMHATAHALARCRHPLGGELRAIPRLSGLAHRLPQLCRLN